MITKELTWLEFTLLKQYPWVQAAFFTRHGGVSQGSFASLNVGSGDLQENVAENLRRIQQAFGTDHLVGIQQIHSASVALANQYSAGLQGDALLTNQKACSLLIKVADCQAALFVDPKNIAIAAVHAGWRGQVQNIYEETIRAMEQNFGSKRTDLVVCIGPSLGAKHSQFINYRTEFPERFWDFNLGNDHFDLKAIARCQLLHAGIKPENIEISPLCTFENEEDFFSYRRDRIVGRAHAFVAQIIGPNEVLQDV